MMIKKVLINFGLLQVLLLVFKIFNKNLRSLFYFTNKCMTLQFFFIFLKNRDIVSVFLFPQLFGKKVSIYFFFTYFFFNCLVICFVFLSLTYSGTFFVLFCVFLEETPNIFANRNSSIYVTKNQGCAGYPAIFILRYQAGYRICFAGYLVSG